MAYWLSRSIIKSLDAQIRDGMASIANIDMLLSTFPLVDVIEMETSGKQKESLLQLARCKKAASAALDLRGELVDDYKVLQRQWKAQAKKLAQDLVKGEMADFYFLDQVDVCDKQGNGFVVLMRQVRSLHARYASAIASGIESSCDELARDLANHLTFEHEPICLVTGELRSPFIEHFMQRFSRLWDEIGLEDHEKSVLERAQMLATGDA